VPSLPPVSDRNCGGWPLRERIPRGFHAQWRPFLRTRLCQWLSLRMMVPITGRSLRRNRSASLVNVWASTAASRTRQGDCRAECLSDCCRRTLAPNCSPRVWHKSRPCGRDGHQALQLLDMRGPESEGIAFEILQHARCRSVSRSDAPETSAARAKAFSKLAHGH